MNSIPGPPLWESLPPGGSRSRTTAANPANPEPNSPVIPAKSLPRTRYGAGIQEARRGPVAPQPTPLTLSPAHPSFPRKACPVLDTGREPRGAGAVAPQPTPLTLSPAHPSFPRTLQSSFPRKACPVLDTGREPRGAAGAAAPQPTPLTLSPPKDDRIDKARRPRTRRTRTQRRRDGAARAAIRREALGSERIEEEKDERPAPAELTIAERRIREKTRGSTGTSRTPGQDPSTPRTPAARHPSEPQPDYTTE